MKARNISVLYSILIGTHYSFLYFHLMHHLPLARRAQLLVQRVFLLVSLSRRATHGLLLVYELLHQPGLFLHHFQLHSLLFKHHFLLGFGLRTLSSWLYWLGKRSNLRLYHLLLLKLLLLLLLHYRLSLHCLLLSGPLVLLNRLKHLRLGVLAGRGLGALFSL